MDMVTVLIDNKSLQVPANFTILEAAKQADIKIPTLCFLKGINEIGACRMCLVEVKGAEGLQTACNYRVGEGMEILTQTPAAREARKVTLELILSNHEKKCLTCVRSTNCELQQLAAELNVREIPFEGETNRYAVDELSPSIVRDQNKCILCRRCANLCPYIDVNGRGFKTIVSPAFQKSISATGCVSCGQCINACPVGAIREKDNTDRVWEALADNDRYVIVQTAPSVRAALGEEFGLPIGSRVTGKMVSALKAMGFDKVFDTDTGADLTIMEEGTELINRLKNGGKLPLITSCCPGWIKFCEQAMPAFIPNLSSCKSPHEMFGAVLKSYYAEKHGIDPAKIITVSIMPCTAKKFEAQRPELASTGYPDVDVVLTTRELARMIKTTGIQFTELPDSNFDEPMGEASGAGVIFGATGGVMEAALRTVAEVLNGNSLNQIEYKAVRGIAGVREVTIEAGGMQLKAAVVHGSVNIKNLLQKVQNGEVEYHFIEVMFCPGGCVNGGGQPIRSSQIRNEIDLRTARAGALYEEDQDLPIRKSHENPRVKALYDEYFAAPGSPKAHKLLHTHYVVRGH